MESFGRTSRLVIRRQPFVFRGYTSMASKRTSTIMWLILWRDKLVLFRKRQMVTRTRYLLAEDLCSSSIHRILRWPFVPCRYSSALLNNSSLVRVTAISRTKKGNLWSLQKSTASGDTVFFFLLTNLSLHSTIGENVSITQRTFKNRLTGIPCLIHVIHPPLSVSIQLAADCICPGAQDFMRALMHSNFNAP